MNDFILKIPSEQINEQIQIVLQFGGEKSPSKTSIYKYSFINNLNYGPVEEECIYLIEKIENKLPSDISYSTSEETIEYLLNL